MAIVEETEFIVGQGPVSKTRVMTIGIFLTVLGLIALFATFTTTLATVMAAGVLLLIGAAFQVVMAIQSRKGSETIGHAAMAFLYVIAGAYLIANPIAGAISLTTVLGIFFIASGLVRIGHALYNHRGSWGWSAMSGFVTMALGVVTLMYLPEMSAVLLGTFIAVDMIFVGTTMIGFATTLGSTSSAPTAQVSNRGRKNPGPSQPGYV